MDRKLAARVLRKWTEDFVDEDTGEVVTIERNEIILERDIVLDEENIELILEAEAETVILHKEKTLMKIILLFIIRFKKILQVLKLKQFNISIAS